MKISYNWLQDLIKKKLPSPEKVADLLTMHSFETSASAKASADKDYVLDVDVLPNRAHDALSHLGIARELSVILKYPFKPVDYAKKIKFSKKGSVKDLVKVEVRDKKLCPRYTARAVVDIKVAPSPNWIKERLMICGLRPINNVVDIANYVMIETGQPLHAFDADKMTGGIIVRKAKKIEKITTLDNEKYDLDENILVIADKEKAVCVAGIKGGKEPEIDGQTKRVILEAANFNPQIIRGGSKQLKLQTDASWRFEHELDPNLTESAIDMAAYLIQEIANGQTLNGIVDVYPNKVRSKKIKLDIERVNSLLGVDIPAKEVKSILERLGFLVTGSMVTVPTRRLDVSILEDLVEEIAQLYGYEKIPSQLPKATLIPSKRNEDLIYQNKVKDILANLGFSEVYNYSFVSDKGEVELLNPISQDQKYLRPNLMINLIKNINENKKYFNEVRLFEIGKVFERNKNKVIEKKKLGLVLFPADFYRLKGVVETLLNKLRISDVWYDDSEKNNRAEARVGQDLLGWIDDNAFELDFEKLVKLATEEREYQAPSKYPAVVRDIALLVKPGTRVIEVMNLIHASGGPLIRDIDLFDMYEGEEIPDGKKNLAFHIIYQADDHTLTDKEVNQLHQKIMKALEEEGGWEVRK